MVKIGHNMTTKTQQGVNHIMVHNTTHDLSDEIIALNIIAVTIYWDN